MDRSAFMMYPVHPIGGPSLANSRLGHVLLPVVSPSKKAVKQQRVPILFPKR
jgi:hypothetical protein